jgi:thiol-disulfide isomerase/thioredoxin
MRRATLLITLISFMLLASCSRTEAPSSSPVAQGRDGGSVVISPEEGKVTLVHFWATWCGPCMYELPSFVAFAKASEGDRLRWVAVANDRTFEVVDQHLERSGIAMETLLDPHGSTMRSWQVNAIPTTIVLDASGTEVARYVGAHNWNDPRQREAVLAFAR